MFRYFILTIKHKWYVFLAGLKVGAPIWHLIIHDWSKFFPSELPHYGRQFCGKGDDPLGFATCWLKHQNRHPHHWEFWVSRSGRQFNNEPLPMPLWAVREMVADWVGASRAYEGFWPDRHNWIWLQKKLPGMILHPTTKAYIEGFCHQVNG